MTVVVVPYHQDVRLGAELIPLPDDGEYLVLEPDLPDGDIWHRLTALDDAVAEQVAAAERGRAGPVTVISGDCLVAVATVAGLQRAGLDPALIWFDAHGDVHTLETSTSGYLGGLSLRLALGAHADRLAGLGLRPLREDRALLVDARDLDPAEARYLAASAVRRSTVTDLDAATLPDGPLVLHIDLDVIDDAELPGLLFPVPGGPSVAAVLAAIGRVLDTGRVAALDIACPWHPAPDGRAQLRRAELIAALLAMPA